MTLDFVEAPTEGLLSTMKYDNQLRLASQIVGSFRGEMPLHNWLKGYFRANKQMGSRDRKQIAELVYCYYRMGHGWKEIDIKERILQGIFLCHKNPNEILEYFKPNWNKEIQIPLNEKLRLLDEEYHHSPTRFTIEKIFPWEEFLSDGIDCMAFSTSFLLQPDLFIRIRPGFESIVRKKLKNAGISFYEIESTCLALANSASVDKILALNKEAVIQDLNSQRVGRFFIPAQTSHLKNAWDCCAASGGKSILLKDLSPDIHLTVSDNRESILQNLSRRFREAGIKKYESFVGDLSVQGFKLPSAKSFDLIIADLPCTGSGTWGRTPESLFFFDPKEIDRYARLQRSILNNIVPALSSGGALIYITCSVFRKENEDQVAFLQKEFTLKEEKTELLKGYQQNADSMFVSRLVRASNV